MPRYFSCKSFIILKLLQEKYQNIKALSGQNIHRIVKKFELRGTVNDTQRGASGRPRSARSDKNFESLRTVTWETPTKSARILDNEKLRMFFILAHPLFIEY